MRGVLLLLVLVLAGCGGVAYVSPAAPRGTTFATSWTADRCQVLLDQRDASTWAAALGGALSGVGGISTALPDDDADTSEAEARRWRLGLGISTAVIAAVATSMTVLAKMKSDEFELYCNTAPPPAAPPPAPAPVDGGVP